MPLFFWLLDVAIVNSYLVHQKAGSTTDQLSFRLGLAWDLVKLANDYEFERGTQRRTRKQQKDPEEKALKQEKA